MSEIATLEAEIRPVRPDYLPGPLTASGDGMIVPHVTHIGRGYDIHGPYATSASTKEQLFDLTDRITAGDSDYPQRANLYAEVDRLFGEETFGLRDIEPKVGGKAATYSESGHSLNEIRTETSTKLGIKGSYKAFSGEFERAWSDKTTRSAASYYSWLRGRYEFYTLELKPRRPLRELLLGHVREALDNWDAARLCAEFFGVYGGYYVHGAVIGGSLNVTLARTIHTTLRTEEISNNLEATYSFGVGDITGTGSTEKVKAARKVLSGTRQTVESLGGAVKPVFGDKGDISRWRDSLLAQPDMIDFYASDDRPGLRPVWDLVDDTDRAALIMAAFEDYIRGKGLDFGFLDPDLKPLHVYRHFDDKNNLRLWKYTTKPDAVTKPWKAARKGLRVYYEPRPECTQFFCVSKKKVIKGGIFKSEVTYHIHSICKSVPKGWTKLSSFWAPEKPLKGSLDKWVPIYRYQRMVGDHTSGDHFGTEASMKKEKNWRKEGGIQFYAAKA